MKLSKEEHASLITKPSGSARLLALAHLAAAKEKIASAWEVNEELFCGGGEGSSSGPQFFKAAAAV